MKQGLRSMHYSMYTVYDSPNNIHWYHFFTAEECTIKKLLYYLDYGDSIIKIKNDNELVSLARQSSQGWASPKIKTEKIYELDSTVFGELLEQSIKQSSSSLLPEDIRRIKTIMEQLILRLSVDNVFRINHFLKDKYNFEISNEDKVKIVNWCIPRLIFNRYNNYKDKVADITARLNNWLLE